MEFANMKVKKIMKKKNLLFFILFLILFGALEMKDSPEDSIMMDVVISSEHEPDLITKSISSEEDISKSYIKLAELKLIVDGSVSNKVLKDQAVSYCQIILEAKPIENVAKMAHSLDNAKIFINKLQKLVAFHCKNKDVGDVEDNFESAKKNFLSDKGVVGPIRDFLETMHEYKDFLLGLAKESLDGADMHFESSMTCKFLKIGKGEAPTFFDNHITSMKELIQITKELIAFLGDFEKSMPEIFKKGRIRLEQIKKDKAEKK